MTTVRYPQSIFRFLRIHVFDEGGLPLPLTNAVVMMQPETKRKSRSIRASVVSASHDAIRNQSSYVLDAGAKNLPLASITLSAVEPNFYRHVRILAGNDTSNLESSGSGIVYRFTTERYNDSKLDIDLNHARARYVKLVIMNRNDQPIRIREGVVEILQYELVVKPSEERLLLWLGNWAATAAQYDLSNEILHARLNDAGTGKLGEAIKNENFVELDIRPWSELHPLLLWAVFAGVFAVLLILVLRLSRASSRPPKTGAEEK